MSRQLDVRYQIDRNDRITFVDDAWTDVALRDDAPELAAERVVGQSLWSFIADEATRQLYRKILATVRLGHPVQFTIRCDAPAERRLLELHLETDANDTVVVATRTVNVFPRPPVALLSRGVPRALDESIAMCAWCNKVAVSSNDWLEVEAAMTRLRLFERSELPTLAHGICPFCERFMLSTLQRVEMAADARSQ